MDVISKSTFLQFQMCPKDTWLRRHKPELVEMFARTDFEERLMEQGNEVEAFARQLFPGATLIASTGDDAVAETRRLMESATGAIFQATFLADGFMAKCDVLKRGTEPGVWDIYEIKGTNSRKEGNEDRDHISDLAFQREVLTLAGEQVGQTFVVHLNKDYLRSGTLNIPELFTLADSTDLVEDALLEVAPAMQEAKKYLSQLSEPTTGCNCHKNGRSRHCRTFGYSHPEVPEYSIHDIARIGTSRKKLEDLVKRGIYEIADVPDDFQLSDSQTLQVRAYKTGQPIIDKQAIKSILDEYVLPLYFLDYETYSPAIPAFDGYGPYHRIPFQLSLHILRDENGEPEHVELLHLDRSDPTIKVMDVLDRNIQPGGSVVVWNASFERAVNKDLARRLGGVHAVRIEQINGSIRDLRDFFSKQYYVHPKFRGGTSIKDVLPVLVPDLSYGGLAIRDGTMASEKWWSMTAPETSAADRAVIAGELRAYCKLDSYAMFAIWRKLRSI